MPASSKCLLCAAALLGAAAVALGAYGAHALLAKLSPRMFTVWQTANQYHFWHALALLGAGLASIQLPHSKSLLWAGALFAFGVLAFSGSLYLLALGAAPGMERLAPIGGVALIAGWLALGLAVARS